MANKGLPGHLLVLLNKAAGTHRLRKWQNICGTFAFKHFFGTYQQKENTQIDMKRDSEEPNSDIKHSGKPVKYAGIKDDTKIIGESGKLVCVADYEMHCKLNLPPGVLQYISTGSMSKLTKNLNKTAFSNILISPRHFVDVSNPNIQRTIPITEETISSPIGLAPTGLHCSLTPEGERATVRAAKNSGVVYISSMDSSTKLEDIAATEPDAFRWQQLYFFEDRKIMLQTFDRVRDAGVTAIVLTIDKPVHMKDWAFDRGLWKIPKYGFPNYSDNEPKELATNVTWNDVTWLCQQTSLPVILKGVLTPEDARMAIEVGAKGVIVSNHGGRSIDCLPATINVLQSIVHASEGKLEVYMDGGISTGLDVFKALAYGAKMVFIGRASMWGLGHSGQAGLEAVLQVLKEELLNTMVLAGTPTLQDITMDRIHSA